MPGHARSRGCRLTTVDLIYRRAHVFSNHSFDIGMPDDLDVNQFIYTSACMISRKFDCGAYGSRRPTCSSVT